jgi:hypothetical protein
MDRRSRWIYFLPSLHLSACLISFVGILVPSLQYIGILFTFILAADLPISLPAYFLAWKYPALGLIWIFVVGTVWWYLLSRCARFLFIRFIQRNEPVGPLTE